MALHMIFISPSYKTKHISTEAMGPQRNLTQVSRSNYFLYKTYEDRQHWHFQHIESPGLLKNMRFLVK